MRRKRRTLNSFAVDRSFAMSNTDLRGEKETIARSFLLDPDRTAFDTYIVPCEVWMPPLSVRLAGILLSLTERGSTTSRIAVVNCFLDIGSPSASMDSSYQNEA